MICIMAASGQVGRGTLQALLDQGVPPSQIVAAVRHPEKLSGVPDRVQVRRADYEDRQGMEAAFRGIDTLVLIPTTTPAAPRCVEHGNALDAAKAAGVERVVFLSLQAASTESRFKIAPFILFAECATRLSGLRWTMARMSLYTDPLAEWTPELARMGRLPYPVKNARIAYVSRADVARGLAAIARNPNLHGEIVGLTGPDSLSMPDLAEVLSKAIGTSIRFTTITDDEYRELCRKDGLPEEMIDLLVTLYHAAEAQEFSKVSADIESLTGTRPESVAEAVRRLTAAAHTTVS